MWVGKRNDWCNARKVDMGHVCEEFLNGHLESLSMLSNIIKKCGNMKLYFRIILTVGSETDLVL